jgi:hypothetical protein
MLSIQCNILFRAENSTLLPTHHSSSAKTNPAFVTSRRSPPPAKNPKPYKKSSTGNTLITTGRGRKSETV